MTALEVTSQTLESALPRITAPLSTMAMRDRNRMIKEFDRLVVEGIEALSEVAALRLPLVFEQTEESEETTTEGWRSLLDQARRSSQVLDEMGKSLRDNVRRLTPHRLGDFQRAARSAQENLLDLRAAMALRLEDEAELDDIGWTAPEDPPIGTRGPMQSLEDLRREHGC